MSGQEVGRRHLVEGKQQDKAGEDRHIQHHRPADTPPASQLPATQQVLNQ